VDLEEVQAVDLADLKGVDDVLRRLEINIILPLENDALASAGRICVMMTAMNVANLPPALIRSGRVELWLEMKLPDPAARGLILERHIGDLPEELRKVDLELLVARTEAFTGADLRRLVEDGKAIYAYDRAKQLKLNPPTEYFLKAVDVVRENRQRYLQAEAQAALKPKSSLSDFSSYFMGRVTSETED
jgi:ATP-dependent 26S proteasome regulatory subunit